MIAFGGAVGFANDKMIPKGYTSSKTTINSQLKKTVNVVSTTVKSKITPPILLFIIDNSGSMYQSIFSNSKYSNKIS